MQLRSGGGCVVVLVASLLAVISDPTCARSIMIWWMTMLALGPRTFLVYIALPASSISSRWERSVLRETGGESLRPGVQVHRHIQGTTLLISVRSHTLRPIGSNCTVLVLDFLDACSGQAEDVCPQRNQIDYGRDGLGCSALAPRVLSSRSYD